MAKLSPGIHYPTIKGIKRKVQVLKSGKWKFLKKSKRSRKTKSVKRRKPRKYVRRRTHMPKKRRGRRSFFSMQTVFKFIKLGAFMGSAANRYDEVGGSTIKKIGGVLISYGGYRQNFQFDWKLLSQMWGPYVATTLISTGVQKLNGIIRRL